MERSAAAETRPLGEGDTCWTPFEPQGTVRIESIVSVNEWPSCGRKIANVVFVGDHPHGYKDGSKGQYYLDELRRGVVNSHAP